MIRVFLVVTSLCLFHLNGVTFAEGTNEAFHTEKGSVAIAGTITGPTDVCLPSSGSQYTVSGSSATSGYTWTVTGSGTIASGQGSKTVTITFSSGGMGMNIHVSGNGLSADFGVNAYAKPITGTIQGASSACRGQAGVAYNVSGFSNLTSFQWTPPANVTLSSTTGGSTSATFSPSFVSGALTVVPYNGTCAGTAATKILTGIVLPSTPGAISGATTVSGGTNGVGYSISSIPNATAYQWSVPSGTTIASGSGTNSITLNFASSFTGGYLYVNGLNGTCNGPLSQPQGINVPGPAGAISGNTNPCAGASGTTITYSVPTIANATSYEWTMTGGTIVGTSNTNSVNVNFPSSIPAGVVTITARVLIHWRLELRRQFRSQSGKRRPLPDQLQACQQSAPGNVALFIPYRQSRMQHIIVGIFHRAHQLLVALTRTQLPYVSHHPLRVEMLRFLPTPGHVGPVHPVPCR